MTPAIIATNAPTEIPKNDAAAPNAIITPSTITPRYSHAPKKAINAPHKTSPSFNPPTIPTIAPPTTVSAFPSAVAFPSASKNNSLNSLNFSFKPIKELVNSPHSGLPSVLKNT